MSVRAIIADDEEHIAADLRARLTALWPELEVLAIARNGIEAAEMLDAAKPDVAFLDIKMPGMTGLNVVQHLMYPCLLVFVTAYDDFAVDAFERAAIDYLVKPVSDERLAKTVDRLKHAVKHRDIPDVGALMADLRQAGSPASTWLKWIKASAGSRVHLVPIDEVCYFQATDKYTSVYTRDAHLLIRTPIKELIRQLDPDQFWQIHRATVVNAKQVDAAVAGATGQLLLKLRDRPDTLPVYRSYAPLFKQM